MKLAIVGGRDFNDPTILIEYLHSIICFQEELFSEKVIVISGGAKGADAIAKKSALIAELEYIEYPAEWDKYGKYAGFHRNQTIVDNCGMVLAFWDGKSRGTADTIEKAKRAKKPTFIVYY